MCEITSKRLSTCRGLHARSTSGLYRKYVRLWTVDFKRSADGAFLPSLARGEFFWHPLWVQPSVGTAVVPTGDSTKKEATAKDS